MRHKANACIRATNLRFLRSIFDFEINKGNDLGLGQGVGQVVEIDSCVCFRIDYELAEFIRGQCNFSICNLP
jgi:hypothetical protein